MDFYRDFNITLLAGEIRPITAYGRFLTILDNSTATDLVVSIDGNAGQAIPSGVSVALPADQNYQGFYIQNVSGGNMTVRFAISSGTIVDSRFKVSSTLNVNILNASVPVADANNTLNTRSLNGDTGTQINKDGSVNNATVTIYTVTAGKNLYLTDLFFSVGPDGATFGSAWVDVTNAADVHQYYLVFFYRGGCAPYNLRKPIKIPATYKIKAFSSNANMFGQVCLNGWEE